MSDAKSSFKMRGGDVFAVAVFIVGVLAAVAYLLTYPVKSVRELIGERRSTAPAGPARQQVEVSQKPPTSVPAPSPDGPAPEDDATAALQPPPPPRAEPKAGKAVRLDRAQVSHRAMQLRLAHAQMESARAIMADLCGRGPVAVDEKKYEGDGIVEMLIKDDIEEIERICEGRERPSGPSSAKRK